MYNNECSLEQANFTTIIATTPRNIKKFSSSIVPIPHFQSSYSETTYPFGILVILKHSSRFGHTSAKHIVFDSSILVLRFSPTNWYIFMFVHVHNLSLHRHEEQDKKVHKQDRPEDGNIKHRKESHHYGRKCTPRTC